MRRYYKGQDRDVYRTLRQKEDSDSRDTSSVYLRSTMEWTPEEGRRKRGRPKKTWRTTFKEGLQLRGICWYEVEAAAAESTRWRYLAAFPYPIIFPFPIPHSPPFLLPHSRSLSLFPSLFRKSS